MTPGKQLDELWLKLQRAQSPLTQMLAVEKISRSKALMSIGHCRRVLDEMERLLKGEQH